MGSNKHAQFGSPSSLYRTIACPGWIAYTKDIPKSKPSEHAEEGTRFHGIMEQAVQAYLDGVESYFTDTDVDMYHHARSCLDRIVAYIENFKHTHIKTEIFLELPLELTDDIYGTADLVLTGVNNSDAKTDITIIDYKYGMNPVPAEENAQGIAYMLSAIEKFGPEDIVHLGEVKFIIDQVRLGSWDEYTLKNEFGLAWYQKITQAVDKAKRIYEGIDSLELNPGSHCRWCPANGACTAQMKEYAPTITMTELPLEETVRSLSLDDRVSIFKKSKDIKKFMDAVASSIRDELLAGNTHPDLKLVHTRSVRKWAGDVGKELIKLGIDNPYTQELIGITETEKRIGKGKIDHLCVMTEPKIDIVSVNDKRPAITVDGLTELPLCEEAEDTEE